MSRKWGPGYGRRIKHALHKTERRAIKDAAERELMEQEPRRYVPGLATWVSEVKRKGH